MKNIEESILNIFKANPTKEYDTSRLTREIFPEEYSKITILFESTDKTRLTEAKRKKFQLHRKLLYYLNKLVNENILRVSKIQEKGEKTFILALEEGDITIEKGHKKITITKPAIISNYIELYEHNNIMKKYDETTWINKINSMMIECSKTPTTEKLYQIITDCIRNVNDVIALNDFEIIINSSVESGDNHQFSNVKTLIDSLSEDSHNFDKIISLIINLSDVKHAPLKRFLEYFTLLNPKKINIIFNLNNKELQKYSELMEFIVEYFSKHKIKLNIKNKELFNSPFFRGKAGIYNFDDSEWEYYSKNVKGKVLGISCSQSAIAINVNQFFDMYHTDKEFRQAILNAAKALLSANTLQRRKSNDYFKNINIMNSPYAFEFYKYGRSYIRFWNYDWHKDISENDNMIQLLKSTKELVDNFCYSEETIFKSCGIPMRFKIAFSSAFRNFDPLFMGERDYKKATVKKPEDFYDGEIKQFIFAREKLFDIFDGGDRLRIFRSTEFNNIDIVREISIMLNSFKIPFFTYDFSGLRGVIRLTNYI
jgi:hypothetical protein